MVSYRDQPAYTGSSGDYASRVDAGAVKTAVAGLSAAGGGDTPESAYSGITAGLDLSWRSVSNGKVTSGGFTGTGGRFGFVIRKG